MKRWDLLEGDVRDRLDDVDDESVDCVVTSPPYWQLRDYDHEGQLGLEETPDEYVEALVGVFAHLHEKLKPTGTLWLNLGDLYLGRRSGGYGDKSTITSDRNHAAVRKVRAAVGGAAHKTAPGLTAKSLVGIPWRVALALQAWGWILRADIIWHKPSVTPSSVRDRPTTAHEYLFLFAKLRRYYYDAAAIREPTVDPKYSTPEAASRAFSRRRAASPEARQDAAKVGAREQDGLRNKRSVWTIPQEPTNSAHTSTFPRALVRPCILAGSPVDGLVFDPFAGTATTGVEALAQAKRFLGIELNPATAAEARANLERAAARGGQPPLALGGAA